MLSLTLRNLVANRVRFALTTLGVILAVSFVVAALTLADGLHSTFGGVSEEITAGIDLQVRPVSEIGEPQLLPAEMVSATAGIEGVADAAAGIEAPRESVRPIKANGEGLPTGGPPQLAFNWVDNPSLSPFTLAEGRAPDVGEFTIDLDSATNHDFIIGESYDFITPAGHHRLTMSGTSSFGVDNVTVGAVLMQVNTAQAPDLFGLNGVNTINLQLESDANPEVIRAALSEAMPTAEIIAGETVTAEKKNEFGDRIDIIGNVLLGFGGVSLFVSVFIIYNTFAIVLGQRTGELALLRTVGATPRQVRQSVLIEALTVGVTASAGGIAAGLGLAAGLQALFEAVGAPMPTTPIDLQTRTVIVAMVVGLGITILAAAGPARKASKVPALAALRDPEAGLAVTRSQALIGAGLGVVGSVSGVIARTGAGSTAITLSLTATAAILIILAVTLLSPLAVGPVTHGLGWPLRKVAGVSGRLATENARRSPRRTATTAAALMIGLAPVSTALVVGESVKSTIGERLDESVAADYIVSDNVGEFRFPAALTAQITADESFGPVSGVRSAEVEVGESLETVASADFEHFGQLVDLDIRQGGYNHTVTNPVLVSSEEANNLNLEVGDSIIAGFAQATDLEMTVTGIFETTSIIDSEFLFDHDTFESVGIDQTDRLVLFSAAAEADQATVSVAIERLAGQYPQSNIDSALQYRERIEGFIDQTLAIANVMVALSVIIALIGIANTLALSVFERTRELGLVRAVGMSRRQVRRMIRLEAALVAAFGAILGVTLGVVFGWGIVTALPDSLASTLSVPVTRIVIVIFVAAAAGVVAAWLPARRAGRLTILDAIAQ